MSRKASTKTSGRRSSVVERTLGKGEVECSIHSGGTITAQHDNRHAQATADCNNEYLLYPPNL